jgi:hypothetical protein
MAERKQQRRQARDAWSPTHEISRTRQVLNARALKCTVVLDPAEAAQFVAPAAWRF